MFRTTHRFPGRVTLLFWVLAGSAPAWTQTPPAAPSASHATTPTQLTRTFMEPSNTALGAIRPMPPVANVATLPQRG